MSEPLILEARDLHKSYRMGAGRLPVLRGVSLQLRPGEVVALMGASGSGKSTLLHLLGLLDRPDQGRVLLDGADVTELGQSAAARLRAGAIGFVFQQFHLLADLNALQNVLMPRRIACGWSWWRRAGRERERARAILEAVGLAGRLRHRPAQLSGGEQQRVAIARALVSAPALLLADEPTGNLDSATGADILALLLRLARQRQAALLLATHDAHVAAHSDRVLQLVDGTIVGAAPGP
ncbi:MAG: ABC transporter ATP-binding protein [Planctomycetota bacterium]|nr:MAG: ABC transporter ATP-binding protein [Planctomycetota bacterium]